MSKSAEQLRAVSFIICFLVGLNLGLQTFEFKEAARIKTDHAFRVAIYVVVTWGIVRVYDVVHEQLLVPWGQRRDNKPVIDVLHIFVRVIIWSLGVLSALNSAGYQVSAILAGLGIGGLAFALAAQDAIANVFGGVIILAQSPFKVGDQIRVGELNGWVLNIGLRSTLIQSWLGHHITIPNKKFTDSAIVNVDARALYWEEMRIRLHHESTLDQVEQSLALVDEVLANNENLGETRWVGVSAIDGGAAEVEVWFGIKKFDGSADSFPNEYMKILGTKSAVHLAILRALADHGIRMALPSERYVVSKAPLTAMAGSVRPSIAAQVGGL
ncbi:MAG: mechanosensitive ion channel family protein [Myxococcota bacterium]